MFTAKLAAPHTANTTLRHPVLERAAEGGTTLFIAPPGYLLTDSLALALSERHRPMLWLRLGPEDSDPATFIVSLISGAQRLHPGIGKATLEQMRRQPGPIAGWPLLFAHLARELAEALPASTALVLEHVHYLDDTRPTLGLLGGYLLPALPDGVACILIADHRLPRVFLPAHTIEHSANDLRLNDRMALAMAERAGSGLPATYVRRAVALTNGRAVTVSGLCTASAVLGPTLAQQVIDRASGTDELLIRIARAWLATAGADTLQALALAMRLEYSHPTLIRAALADTTLPAGPWLQPLADGWVRVRRVWRTPLRKALRAGAIPNSSALRRVADHLSSQDAIEQVVPLYFELGDTASAAKVIAGATDTLMNLGQWETLGGWLGQLPAPALHAWPWLVYAGGEIAAAQGHADMARRAFATATALFTARHDADGACQSLLAESTLAAWHDDRAHAQARALAASALAEASGLAWHEGWAAWQLGCLAAAAGELDNALVYFDRAMVAASTAGDSFMAELLRQAEALARQQHDLQRQREFHRQGYFAAEQAEHEAAKRLSLLLSIPPDGLDALLGTHGWSRIPLILKLPAPEASSELPGTPDQFSLWHRLLRAIRLHRRTTRPDSGHPPAEDLSPPVTPLPTLTTAVRDLSLSTVPTAIESLLPPSLPAPNAAPALAKPVERDQIDLPRPAVEPSIVPTLTAHLLGAFRVTVNDRPIENWPSGRGRALFKYLLTHHDQPTPRDVLMDVFWPNASPEAARNSLNVALHSLRRALRTATDMPVILFQDGAYSLNPDLRLWLDVDEFDRHVKAGRQLEAAGQLSAATAEYELAVGLFQGDFLADDPYEEWPVLTRERLRVAYLDMLDRVGQIHFSQGQYASCITLCQLILARDNCREDAHCRLMRCYSRQGQHHLALRQYQTCVDALRTELEVGPALTTTKLYERIRRRERV